MSEHTHLAGQSLMLSFDGPRASPELLAALTATRACGVILFARNIQSPVQLRELTASLQQHAAAAGLPPLLVGIDQEGGNVSRLPEPFVTVPSPMAQAAAGAGAARQCAGITGVQLRRCGVNLVFAPVLDVNNNQANPVIGTRSYGPDAEAVARHGLEALAGYREAGVIATAKHFPGHGDTSVDSHRGLPVLPFDRERLDAVELVPFRAAIQAGVPAIMSAHIVFQVLDDCPATLSRRVLTELLRHSLGFRGVVFTDALDMRAIADAYGPAEAAVLAKAAGADVVLPLGTLAEQIEVARAIGSAVEQGRLPIEAFADTARRLDRLRDEYRLGRSEPDFGEDLFAALRDDALGVARRSVTVLRGRELLPLPPTTRLAVVDCLQTRFSPAEDLGAGSRGLQELLRAAFPASSYLALGPEPSAADVAQALLFARHAEATLLLTRNASLVPWQRRVLGAFAVEPLALLHAAVRGPYDAELAPYVQATLLTYGDPPVSLQALVEIVSGSP